MDAEERRAALEERRLAERLDSARRDMALTERQLRDNGYHDWPDMIRISVAAYEDALAACERRT